MKYKSVNELDNFQFHDAQIKNILLTDTEMMWDVSAINATTQNTQNDHPKDMCIENATMKFENVCIKNLVFGAYTVHDSDNNLIESVDATTAMPEEYTEILTESTNSYCFIYGMDELQQNPDNTYSVCFNIDGGAGNYYLTFSFSLSTIEWDKFSGEAWYEHPKWKKQ